MPTITLGLDIGGANLKAATAKGVAVSHPFALWKQPDQLGTALRALLAEFPDVDAFALTMTGELCDCFRTKREGVRHILAATETIAAGRPVRVWGTDGAFHTPASARDAHMLVAAANWQALATYAGRFVPIGPALLIDIGSTTADLIPLQDGIPTPTGRTDCERLKCGELLYTGVRRTPLCALLPPGAMMAELFATTLDTWLMCGEIAEDAADRDTADGRPATCEFARERLARMLGADGETVTADALAGLIERCLSVQTDLIKAAIRPHARLWTPILSGSGEFLARRALTRLDRVGEPISLTQRLGPQVAACAPAFALAVLAGERPA